jgi:heat shock protein HslJ
MRTRTLALVLALAAFGCKGTPAPSIEDRDWDLVALGERDHPLGAGGKPATLRFDSATKRAGGNAGCNRYNAAYVLHGDSVSFAAAMATKMACPDGMELENAWLGTIDKLVTWSATESTLVLAGPDGPLARFVEHRAP